jgi:hypothetical protein
VTDPVKALQIVRQRLAHLAALRTLTASLPPIIVLLAAALGWRALGFETWERWGFMLAPQSARHVQIGILAAAVIGLVAAAVAALISFTRSEDTAAAAELVDRKLGSHEEVLTLATLADTGQSTSRSPLFPILWRRAADHLDRLDPVKAFPFQVSQPLGQGLFLAVCTAGLLITGITVLLAANKPPLGAEARQLRRIAREIANSRADAAARELADKLRAIASTLENPKVPPETKLEQLASVEQQLKAQQQRNQQQEGGSSKGQTGGKGTQGQGAGEGKEGSGQGQERAGQGKGTGKGSAGTGQSKSGDNQMAEARKDIAKVQAQLEAEAAKQKGPKQSDTNGLKARAPRPGEKPDLAKVESINDPKLKQLKDLSQIKSSREHGQEPNSNRSAQSGQPKHRDFGSSKGDTHLGQFPEPGNFERFYKAGEHGPPMDVKNARYVLFRIPPAVQRGGGGKAVTDNERPSATVPYENLPLNAERIAADPDEHQLVPPRYRDLLR